MLNVQVVARLVVNVILANLHGDTPDDVAAHAYDLVKQLDSNGFQWTSLFDLTDIDDSHALKLFMENKDK